MQLSSSLKQVWVEANIAKIPHFISTRSNHSSPSDSNNNIPSDSNNKVPSNSNNKVPSDSNNNALPNSNSSPLLEPEEIDITMSAPEMHLEPDKEGYTSSSAEFCHIQYVLDLNYSVSPLPILVPSMLSNELVTTISVFTWFAYIYRHEDDFSFKL
jgi:hypothetical protein